MALGLRCRGLRGLDLAGERLVVMRHDVDNLWGIYGRGLASRVKKLANYAYLALSPVRLRSLLPGFLECVLEVVDLERDYGARSTFFFRVPTAPTRELARELVSKGFEIGYHSDRNDTFDSFLRDLRLLERLAGVKVLGFTKHGHSPVRDGGPWDEGKFVEYGVRAGLKYLAQGEGHPDWELPRVVGGLVVFGHHVTLRRCRIEDVRAYVRSRRLPLILVHPEDISAPGEREKFEEVLSMGRAVSVAEVLRALGAI